MQLGFRPTVLGHGRLFWICCMKCQPESRSHSSFVVPRQLDSGNSLLEASLIQLYSGDFNARWQAAKSLKTLGEIAHPALMKLAEDTQAEPDVLCFVVEILGANPSPEILLALVRLLKETTSEDVQESIILTLAKQGPSCIEALLPYGKQPSLQKVVLKALIQINHPATLPGLISFTVHHDPNLRAIALEGLGQFHNPEILALLQQGLEDESANVRATCSKAMGLRLEHEKSPQVIESLIPLLDDLDPKVRSITAKSLGRMNHPQSIVGTLDLLHSTV
ncbi:MAG: HEAT repeat domain-containing protein [Acaryochloridaceae cyanobacterium RL_2_7]|nr:HEAT repeat domain-containing protein [Acaryochloridaceae cyanobacterium RL_2_7]